MPSTQSDHDLLVIIGEQQKEMRERLNDALEQLKRGNERFTSISLRDQELGAAIAELRQNYSRAMLTADQARTAANAAQSAIDTFRVQMRTIAWVGAPIVGITTAIVTILAKNWFGL